MRVLLSILLCGLFFPIQAVFAENYPPAAAKGATIPVGTKVFFEDIYNRYGGGMISGVIVRDRGPGFSRYTVRIDKPTEIAFQENQFQAEELHPVVGLSPAVPKQVQQAQPSVKAQPPVQAQQVQAPQVQQKPGGQPINLKAIDWGRPPGPGNFKYGHFNPKPMLGDKNITPPGLKPIFTGTPPGDESPIGRWYTQTGGVWTNKGGPDRDGNQTQVWGPPANAEVIIVQPGGNWAMSYHGKVTTGKWYDIGQNVIRLVNMADGCDWTASVYDKMIEFKGQNGLMKQGNRY